MRLQCAVQAAGVARGLRRWIAWPLLSAPRSRGKAVEDVLSHSEWSLAESVRHLKKTMRLTTAEMAKLSGVAYLTMQDIEQQRSEGRVQTMNRIFGMLGLKLAVPLGCLLVGGLAPLLSVTASAVPEAWEAFKV